MSYTEHMFPWVQHIYQKVDVIWRFPTFLSTAFLTTAPPSLTLTLTLTQILTITLTLTLTLTLTQILTITLTLTLTLTLTIALTMTVLTFWSEIRWSEMKWAEKGVTNLDSIDICNWIYLDIIDICYNRLYMYSVEAYILQQCQEFHVKSCE